MTASRADVPPFIVMDILARANALEAQGRSIVHMEIGQPSAPAAPSVIAAAQSVLASGRVAYTEAVGVPSLRQAIAAHYGQAHGLDVDPARVAVTTGSSGAFALAFLAAFEAGARVGLVRPYYPAYPTILRAFGLEPVILSGTPGDAGDGAYGLDMDALETAMIAGLDGLLIASPANPTGTVLSDADLARLAALARCHGVRIISDEIYQGIVYAGSRAPSMLAHATDAIIVNSFSKYFCMAGWRIGWLVLPEGMPRAVERLAQNLTVAPPTLGQHAAQAALGADARAYYDGLVSDYAQSRALLRDRLPALGFTRLSPAQGAFYLYADCSGFGMTSRTLCARLLEEAGVAITPGADFDDEGGDRTVRFSFAGAPATVTEAVSRLTAWTAEAGLDVSHQR